MKDEILKRLDALADKMGTTAQYLFGLYVKQARVEAIQDIVYFILGIGMIFGSSWCFKKFDSTKDASDGWMWLCLALGFGGLLFVIMPPFSLPTELFNPEYWAFQHILSDIHGK